MAIEIKAPTFPESVADGTVATWHKQPGDAVKRDELIVDIETDKVVLEVLATADGVLGAIVKNEGDTVLSDEVLGSIVEGGAAAAQPPLLLRPLLPLPRLLPAKTIRSLLRLRASWLKRTASTSLRCRHRQRRSCDQGRRGCCRCRKKAAPAAAPAKLLPCRCCSGVRRWRPHRKARADDPPACQGRRASG
jgi:2-oxoglutarate dehydrogenase E2 component (dihydrolipoamide succinyltransferase)